MVLVTGSACDIFTQVPGARPNNLNFTDTGPITLDPATAAESSSALYIVQIFSGLTKFDENLMVVPDLAEKWEKNPAGTIYTFSMRKDAKFHDGKPVKASDVKYSWERALNPATGSLTAGTYLNDIMGSADMLSGKSTQLSGVQIPDEYTLQVTIDQPKAYFLQKLAYPTAFVVDKNNVQSGSNWWQKPNGTGPFKLQKWQKDQLLVLERNELYQGEKAKLNQVVVKILGGYPLQLYQEGTVDVADVNSAYIGMVTDPDNAVSKELNIFPEFGIYYLGFNTATPPFDDVNVRRAFCHAVDKERLVSLALQDTVTVAYGVLPPKLPGYNPGFQGLRFDPKKAKDLIAASKYGDISKLPPVVLTTSGWGGALPATIGGVIEEWRRNLGIEVTVRQIEPEMYLYSLKKEKNEIFDQGWIADYPDPQDFTDILFRTGAQSNTGNYSNPQLDSLMDKAAVEADPGARLRMYQDIERIIIEDAPILPLYFNRNYTLVKPYVKDYVRSPLGFPLFTKVSIQQ